MAKNKAKPAELSLIITVVNRTKAEFYTDVLSGLGANLQLICAASGTFAASDTSIDIFGLAQPGKTALFSILPKERVPAAMSALDKKFRSVRGGKGISFSVPLSSVIGAGLYSFLLGGKV